MSKVFMKTRNRMGLRIDPWDMPERTLGQPEDFCSKLLVVFC
jgi:hypothetical protein